MLKRPDDYHSHSLPEIRASVASLKAGDSSVVEPILSYLERDVYIIGSGYLKEYIWRYLPRVELTDKQQERLRRVSLHYVQTRSSREFFPMCRFLRTISNDKFKVKLAEIRDTGTRRASSRAALLLAYLESLARGEDARRKLSWRRFEMLHPNWRIEP